MVSHLPWFNDAGNLLPYWIITLIIVGFCEIQALIGPGAGTQKPLTSVSGTIGTGGPTVTVSSKGKVEGKSGKWTII